MTQSHKLVFDQLAREIMAVHPDITYTPFRSQTTIQGKFSSPRKKCTVYIYLAYKHTGAELYTIEIINNTTNKLETKFSQSGRHQIVRRLSKLWN